jgi:hypothetical protein
MHTKQRRSPFLFIATARTRRAALIASGLAWIAACAAEPEDTSAALQASSGSPGGAPSAEPWARAGDMPAVAAAGPVSYHSGPVISNARVTVVYWNSAVAFQSSLPSFYAGVTNSKYFDLYNEYRTSTQGIGRGSLVAAVVDPSPPSGTTVSDAQITAELQRLIGAGTIATPGSNDLYMVHFPPGFVVLRSGFHSCPSTGTEFSFCGYHSWFPFNSTTVRYGVITDVEACGTLCGPGDGLGNTTSTASHELAEAVTDPQGNAWFASDGEEIADLCQNLQGQVSGFTVQQEWSNIAFACVSGSPCLTCPSGFSCHCGDLVCRSRTSQCP